ncbi:MAG: HAD family hydrolase [Clostridia bacterium]|nr:HAD family hydrolase [Clostridia bacterium]
MSVTTVLFDLDGTLLPMDYDLFIKSYFSLLAEYSAPFGYDPKKLTDAVWNGTLAMVKNTGDVTNEELFWNTFCAIYGGSAGDHIAHFEEFYRKVFPQVKSACWCVPEAVETLRLCKELGLTVVLATNPVFPRIATETRMCWAGIEKEAFALVTTYENSRFCKPNPAYFQEVCRTIGVKPEECLMVGNDVSDDMAARKAGMQVFLLTDCLLNSKGEDITKYPSGDYTALQNCIRSLN